MTNGRPKKRGRPRKIKPIPVGDYAPKRVVPVRKKWYQKIWEWIKPKEEVRVTKTQIFLRRVLRLCFVYFSMGFTLAILFVLSLGEPTFISPISPSWGMERGYRIIPISHPEVVYAETEKEVKEQPQTPKTDIERLVLETFGVNQYDTAMCIINHESGANPTRENLGKARVGYRGECSIGLFQINLASNGCTGKKVHWNKAQGNTLSEKIAWLKIPENNVKVAKQLFDASGWNPWTTYKKCN